ncbi:hypothetical protein G6011_00131 [Alternaria panax]|uniref:Uncharacterized protein n=1 Tax=Alternaria panax TaxID=48097 RepID=A0AAD4IHL7_9PLEO|nr:hypothetical protein G6011_00131 [Alternaria panax]
MSELVDLLTELITTIGLFSNASDGGTLRLVNKELQEKMPRIFCLLFKTVKVSLTGISIETLSIAVWCENIAGTINHLIIGTETLDQYCRAQTSLPDAFNTM